MIGARAHRGAARSSEVRGSSSEGRRESGGAADRCLSGRAGWELGGRGAAVRCVRHGGCVHRLWINVGEPRANVEVSYIQLSSDPN